MRESVRLRCRDLSLVTVAGWLGATAPMAAQRPGALVGAARSEANGHPIAGAGMGMGSVDVSAGREMKVDLLVHLPADAESRLTARSRGARASGNAVRSMTGEEIQRRNLRSVADALRLLAPDMVEQGSSGPGGGQTLRPRGVPTVAGSRDVLLVVDGVRVVQSPMEFLGSMNPGDVRRIEVTRGASAGWRYGMQGANGVIIITTGNAGAGHPADTRPEDCRFAFPG